jgi:HlyD family secretion protein
MPRPTFPTGSPTAQTQARPARRRHSMAAGLSLSLALAALMVAGCSRSGSGRWQGYLEGDFVYVSSPLAGRLDTLAVEKGARVSKGAPLFELEHAAETAALSQADQELQAATAQFQDISKGSRPEEIAAMVAHLGQSRAAADLAKLDLARQADLFKAGAISASDYDRARLTHKGLAQSVDEDTARLETARLGGRSDAVQAAKSLVQGAQDAVAHARWSVDQKAQAAPADALVYDTLYRQGEYVTAGSPVVTLLPPANIKVRFFVTEADFGRIRAGDHVAVSVDGQPAPLDGRVTYLSPQPEYTPPVLYNQDNRSKLVYMIEAVFPDKVAADLHPGEPVDVRLPDR